MAAKSSIADVYASLRLSADGITGNLKNEFQGLGDYAARFLDQGIRRGVTDGANVMQTAFSSVAQNAQTDFSSILSGVQVPTATILADFSQIAQSAGSSLHQSISQASSQALQGMAQQIPTQQISSQLSQAVAQGASHGAGQFPTSQISSQMSQAVHQGFTQGTQNVPSFSQPVSNTTQSGAESGFKKAGPAILAGLAGLGIGAVVASSISSAFDRESSTAKMTAQLGLDPEMAKRAGEIAGDLYVNAYGESMEDITNTTSAVLSSFKGIQQGSTAEIEELTKRVDNMRGVFEVDASRISQVAGQMLNAGHVKNGVEALDLLSATMQKVPANVREDVIDAVDEYGPFMKNVGIEGEKMMSLLVASSAKGAFGLDKTGDAMKELGLQVVDAAKNGPVIESLGLSYEKISHGFAVGGKEGAAAFDELVAGLLAIEDPMERVEKSISVFGTPIEDLSITEIPQFLKSLQGVEGGMGNVAQAAINMDNTVGGTMAASFDKFKRTSEQALSEAMLPLVTQLQPMLAQASQWFSDNKVVIGEWVTTIFEAIQNVVVPALATIMPVLAEMFTWLADNKDMLQEWVPAIINTVAVLGTLSIGWQVGTAIVALTTTVRAAAVAFWAAATAGTAFGLSVGWMVLLVAAVFALGFGIGTVISNIIGDFDGFLSSLGDFFGTALSYFTDFGNIFTSGSYDLLGAIGGIILQIVTMIANAILFVVNLIPNLINLVIIGVNAMMGLIPGMDFQIGLLPQIPYIPSQIPALATGAEVVGPTVALIGEKDPEYVLNRGKMNEMMDETTGLIKGLDGGPNGDTTYVTVEVKAPDGVDPYEFGMIIGQEVARRQGR